LLGTGTGIELLQWLEKFTFNYESKYSDLEFARNVYTKGRERDNALCSNYQNIDYDYEVFLIEI
jgi:hypothetical protein